MADNNMHEQSVANRALAMGDNNTHEQSKATVQSRKNYANGTHAFVHKPALMHLLELCHL